MEADVQTKNLVTLRQWLNRQPGGRVSTEQALGIIKQLSSALHQVHINHPFHRDVIPSVIVVTENDDGSYDFSVPDLAKIAENHGEPGARRYLAPEQWWGGRQNTATDQYALAVLFVELVTGEVPFASAFATDDESVMRNAVCEHRVKLPADCAKRDVILRALSKDPRHRFHSCSSFVRALASDSEIDGKCKEGGECGNNPESAASEDYESHSHGKSAHRPPRRVSKVKMALALLLLGGGAFWGYRSGCFERLQEMSRHDERMQQLDALKKLRDQEREAAAQMRNAKLEVIRAEIARQETVSAQALTNLQTFLESGGAAVLLVRQESIDRQRSKAIADLAEEEKLLAADRAHAQALAALRMRTTAYANVAKDIPANGEVAEAYKVLVQEAASYNDLSGKFTEKHPSVSAQKTVLDAALKRFFEAVDGSLKLLNATMASREKQVEELRGKADDFARSFENLSRDLKVAQLKQKELENVREQEANRLLELRRREFDVQFGSESSFTNAPSGKR